jgi:phospholipid/cholesterol/gamma-HCH transport system substrate-binding protein
LSDVYDAIQRRRNIIAGVFVVIALCAFAWLIFIFGDLPIAVSKWRSFDVYVQFPQAPGIERSTAIRFAGYQIGRVIGVEPPRIMQDLITGMKYHQTLVVMAIDKQFINIPSNVRTKLVKRGFGSSYIELDEDPTKLPTPLDPNKPESVYLYEGARLQGSMGSANEFFPEESQKKLEQLVTALKTLIDNSNKIIGDAENQASIKASLANLAEATKQATGTLKSLEKFSDTGTTVLTSTGTDVKNVSNALIETSVELNKTVVEIRTMIQKINEGQGSAGRFVNDASLYENLLDSSLELQQAMEELKLLLAQSREKGIPLKLK